MSARGVLSRVAPVAGLVAVSFLVARAWRRSRTQVHTITHGRG